MHEDREYHVIASNTMHLGRFQIRLDTVKENGKCYPYSYVDQKDSVGILAFEGEKVILIRQYRHSINSYEYEIPGGGIDEGEEPLQVAYREMLEETGYSIIQMDELGIYYPSPGSSNEKCYLYLARCQKERIPETEPLEYIETIPVDEMVFTQWIREGIFKHSMGLVAWLKYCIRRGKL